MQRRLCKLSGTEAVEEEEEVKQVAEVYVLLKEREALHQHFQTLKTSLHAVMLRVMQSSQSGPVSPQQWDNTINLICSQLEAVRVSVQEVVDACEPPGVDNPYASDEDFGFYACTVQDTVSTWSSEVNAVVTRCQEMVASDCKEAIESTHSSRQVLAELHQLADVISLEVIPSDGRLPQQMISALATAVECLNEVKVRKVVTLEEAVAQVGFEQLQQTLLLLATAAVSRINLSIQNLRSVWRLYTLEAHVNPGLAVEAESTLTSLLRREKDIATHVVAIELTMKKIQHEDVCDSESESESDSDTEAKDQCSALKREHTALRRDQQRIKRHIHSSVQSLIISAHRECQELLFPQYIAEQCRNNTNTVNTKMKGKKKVKVPRWYRPIQAGLQSDGLMQPRFDISQFELSLVPDVGDSQHLVYKGVCGDEVYLLKMYSEADASTIMREAQTLRACRHRYIAEVIGIIPDPSRRLLYLLMPLYEGGTLQSLLEGVCEAKQPAGDLFVDCLRVRTLHRQLLIGLAHIHSKGVVHCDIKPDNLFLTHTHSNGSTGAAEEVEIAVDNVESSPYSREEIRIGDFDVSRSAASRSTVCITTTIRQGFTLEYAAPEVVKASGNAVTDKADLYSAGLVLFDLQFPPGCAMAKHRPSTASPLNTVARYKEFRKALRGHEVAEDLIVVLCALLTADPTKRPSAVEALGLAFYTHTDAELLRVLDEERKAQLGPTHTCCVCLCTYPQAHGVLCPHKQSDHFLCDSCLDRKVIVDCSDENMASIMRRRGHILCALSTVKDSVCYKSTQAYPDDELAKHVSPETFTSYLSVQRKRLEQESAKKLNEEVKRELQRLRALDEKSRAVRIHHHHITEEILTLRCSNPNGCRQAFVDFEGCFALSCSLCGGAFCGWCLQWCGEDAHPHVRRCRWRLGEDIYYGSDAEFERAHQTRRERVCSEYPC